MRATTIAKDHLDRYLAERLPVLTPGIFEGAYDEPSFTVDQQKASLKEPPYPFD